jgi:hypothetical protein
VDRDALLCALVLAPTTFARNRFFALYTEPWAKRTRSRAAQLRTIVRHLAALTPKSELRELLPLENGGAVVRYGVPDLHFERTAVLEPLELSVVRFALARRQSPVAETDDGGMAVTPGDRQTVERALSKLSHKLGVSPIEFVSSTLPPGPNTGDS